MEVLRLAGVRKQENQGDENGKIGRRSRNLKSEV
jgi:hypothetical protein